MRKRKPEQTERPPFRPCGKCYSGLVRVERSPGQYVMRQCACMAAFKAGGKVVSITEPFDRKAAAVGSA